MIRRLHILYIARVGQGNGQLKPNFCKQNLDPLLMVTEVSKAANLRLSKNGQNQLIALLPRDNSTGN